MVKDTYFRRHMDEQGWVPVSLIASFNKVIFVDLTAFFFLKKYSLSPLKVDFAVILFHWHRIWSSVTNVLPPIISLICLVLKSFIIITVFHVH